MASSSGIGFGSILLSILITAVLYGAFPLIFANTRPKEITSGKYWAVCIGVNAGLTLLFWLAVRLFAVETASVSLSIAPCILWTAIFCALGTRKLRRMELLSDENAATAHTTVAQPQQTWQTPQPQHPSARPARFCAACGTRLNEGVKFCPKCGKPV